MKKNREDYNLPLKILSAPPLEPFAPARGASALPLTLGWRPPRTCEVSKSATARPPFPPPERATPRSGPCRLCGEVRTKLPPRRRAQDNMCEVAYLATSLGIPAGLAGVGVLVCPAPGRRPARGRRSEAGL